MTDPPINSLIKCTSSLVISLFKFSIEAASFSRSIALPSLLFLLSPSLLRPLLHITLHFDPLLFRTPSLLLFLIFQQLLQEFGYAEKVKQDKVAEEDAGNEKQNEGGPHVCSGARYAL